MVCSVIVMTRMILQFGCWLGCEPSWVSQVLFRSWARSQSKQRARIVFVPGRSRWQGLCMRAPAKSVIITDAVFSRSCGQKFGSGKPRLKLKILSPSKKSCRPLTNAKKECSKLYKHRQNTLAHSSSELQTVEITKHQSTVPY